MDKLIKCFYMQMFSGMTKRTRIFLVFVFIYFVLQGVLLALLNFGVILPALEPLVSIVSIPLFFFLYVPASIAGKLGLATLSYGGWISGPNALGYVIDVLVFVFVVFVIVQLLNRLDSKK